MNVVSFKVAGVTFEGRQERIALLDVGDPVRLIPEPENPYDSNALAVHVAYAGVVLHVGYMPREEAAQVAPILDGESVQGLVARLVGTFPHKGVIVTLELTDEMETERT